MEKRYSILLLLVYMLFIILSPMHSCKKTKRDSDNTTRKIGLFETNRITRRVYYFDTYHTVQRKKIVNFVTVFQDSTRLSS